MQIKRLVRPAEAGVEAQGTQLVGVLVPLETGVVALLICLGRGRAARFRDRRPPFTQAALDGWTTDVIGRMDLSDLMEPAGEPAWAAGGR